MWALAGALGATWGILVGGSTLARGLVAVAARLEAASSQPTYAVALWPTKREWTTAEVTDGAPVVTLERRTTVPVAKVATRKGK